MAAAVVVSVEAVLGRRVRPRRGQRGRRGRQVARDLEVELGLLAGRLEAQPRGLQPRGLERNSYRGRCFVPEMGCEQTSAAEAAEAILGGLVPKKRNSQPGNKDTEMAH